MPIFGSIFSPKKPPNRKRHVGASKESLSDLLTEEKNVVLTLGDQELTFRKGDWIPESGQNSNSFKSKQKLKKRVQELEEENNLLRLKYEMMLNMLTEATAERHIQQKGFDKLTT
ncbi:unnamed protein product [Phaedon cochleariae]|uniref:Uncharacterized protein n=1 Tax=Phaedon cochleariae TaxID=80249 RepID=A0A9P0DQP5_PHACE|nr:unnamed protein product [Phaedon cochleariae]